MCCVLMLSVGVTSVRAADRLVYFLKRLAHFIMLQFPDYYTYKLVDLLLNNSCLVSATVLSFFPLHFMLYCGNLDCFPNSVQCKYSVKEGFLYTEEKAKVVAAVWGTELIQFFAVIAILH